MSNNKISDQMNQSIDTIITARMSDISFDKTELCTIIKVYTEEDNKLGWYRVSNGSAKFDAKPLNDAEYSENENIYVLIPQGDYSLEKVIIGSYKAEETKRYAYVSPLEKIIVARQIDFEGPLYILTNQEEEVSEDSLIQANTLFPANGFGKFDFICLNMGFDVDIQEPEGEYGFIVYFYCENKVVSSFKISSKDFYGNPYHLTQNIPLQYMINMPADLDLSIVDKIRIQLYQDQLFNKEFDNEKLITLQSLSLSFGYDKEKFNNNQDIEIVWDNPKINSETGEVEYTYSTSEIHNLSLDLFLNSKLYNEFQPLSTFITDINDPNGVIVQPGEYEYYTIYWCQYDIAAYNDPIYPNIEESGKFWAVKQCIFASEPSSYQFIFNPNTNWDQEQFKVIIRREKIKIEKEITIENGRLFVALWAKENKIIVDNSFIPIISEIIKFENTNTSAYPQERINSPSDSIALTLGGEKNTGKYYVYGGDGTITSTSELLKSRTITASYFDERVWGSDNERVSWIIPKSGCMIVPKYKNSTIVKPTEQVQENNVNEFLIETLKLTANQEPYNTLYHGMIQLMSKTMGASPGWVTTIDDWFWTQFSQEDWHNAWGKLINEEKKVTTDQIAQQFTRYGEWVWVKCEFVNDKLILEIVNKSWNENDDDDYYYIKAKAHESNQTVDYSIASQYSQSKGNNKITCKINIGNKSFQGTANFEFGMMDVQGSGYKLNIIPEHYYGLSESSSIKYEAKLESDTGISITPGSGFTWSWYYPEDETLTDLTLTPDEDNSSFCTITRSATSILNMQNYTCARAILKVSCLVEANAGSIIISNAYPIALSQGNASKWFSTGASRVIYSFMGDIISYDTSPYRLYKDDTLIEEKEIDRLEVLTDNNTSGKIPVYQEAFYPTIANGVLQPMQKIISSNMKPCFVYIQSIDKQCLWCQPLLITQDTYANSIINKWDGNLIIDSNKNYILSQTIGAGIKESENEYTGVLMGQVSLNKKINYGLYGFNKGVLAFSFDKDGKAFIGNANTYIKFDPNASIGNNQLEIKIKKGEIAGWSISDTSLVSTSAEVGKDNSIGLYTSFPPTSVTIAGENKNDWRLCVGANFGVDKLGKLYASGAELQGNLSLNDGGLITGWSWNGNNYVEIGPRTLEAQDIDFTQGTRIWTNWGRVINIANAFDKAWIDDGFIYLDPTHADNLALLAATQRFEFRESGDVIGHIGLNSTQTNNTPLDFYAPRLYFYTTKAPTEDGTKVPMLRLSIMPQGGNLFGTWQSESSITVTSDENEKYGIISMIDSYDQMFNRLQPRLYKFKNGTSNRIHTGFIAQEVNNALMDAGLDTMDFAAVVIENPETEEERWGLRYEEFISLNTWQIQKLKFRVAELEDLLREKGVM